MGLFLNEYIFLMNISFSEFYYFIEKNSILIYHSSFTQVSQFGAQRGVCFIEIIPDNFFSSGISLKFQLQLNNCSTILIP